ncbi:hypothetical protein U9M48_001007 [Paspalum notatum var. saurae]|uniref:Uncharacterized protein n=1 Tax=Paspalum notatum var. saurae TaxID=547442 RepID=A0AAQ3PHJ5_PASNO
MRERLDGGIVMRTNPSKDEGWLLHIAAGEGHCNLITELCVRDSTLLSSVNSWLDTPLHSAARSGHADVIDAVVPLAISSVELDWLREIDRWRHGDTALHLAASHGHGEAVEVLTKLAPELAEDVNGAAVSPLYLAVLTDERGWTEEVVRLLTGGGDPRGIHPGPCCTTGEVTAERSTLLHIAAGEGRCSLITELCLRDSTLLSSVNSSLDTPLHSAARSGHAHAVKAIVRLARSSSVEEDRLREIVAGRNSAGDTALHLAARQ